MELYEPIRYGLRSAQSKMFNKNVLLSLIKQWLMVHTVFMLTHQTITMVILWQSNLMSLHERATICL